MSANEVQHGGSHYKKQAIQVWDYITANKIPYLEGNAIKYLSRWRDKGGIEDLLKARHYVDKIIENEQERLQSAAMTEMTGEEGATSTQNPHRSRHPFHAIVQDGHGFGHEEQTEFTHYAFDGDDLPKLGINRKGHSPCGYNDPQRVTTSQPETVTCPDCKKYFQLIGGTIGEAS